MDKIKVYVAAPWPHKDAAAAFADQLEDEGFEVTSRWLRLPNDGGDYATTEEAEAYGKHIAKLKEEALHDLEDIYLADGVIVLQYAKSEGKAFEQGAAIHLVPNKIVVVSPDGTKGNVFQYIDEMYTIVPDLDSAVREAANWTKATINIPGMPSAYRPIPIGEDFEIIEGGPIGPDGV